jgi:hypothetical protein
MATGVHRFVPRLDCASVLDLSVTALDVGYVERRDKIRVKEPLDQEKVT